MTVTALITRPARSYASLRVAVWSECQTMVPESAFCERQFAPRRLFTRRRPQSKLRERRLPALRFQIC